MDSGKLTNAECTRYARNIKVEEIGEAGQLRLKSSRVLVIGCGALGSVAATYLAAAGVGHLIIADADTIDLSNLQRQIFYTEVEQGKSKALSLAARLEALNSCVNVSPITRFLTAEELPELFPTVDIVVEATDSRAMKYAVAAACEEAGTPCCIGGVRGLTGQVMSWRPGCATFADIVPPADNSPETAPGVVGPLPGIIGSVEALEAIKYLTGAGEMLCNRLTTVDGLTGEFRTFSL